MPMMLLSVRARARACTSNTDPRQRARPLRGNTRRAHAMRSSDAYPSFSSAGTPPARVVDENLRVVAFNKFARAHLI